MKTIDLIKKVAMSITSNEYERLFMEEMLLWQFIKNCPLHSACRLEAVKALSAINERELATMGYKHMKDKNAA